uniref:OTU domain-containing protein n=1 Tax=Rhizophora mucronata TaxID=61149 RepID=A0A2P2M1S0_RHIMU
MKMIACEPDPDVVRWGLHTLIDVCAIPNSGSFRSVTQYAADTSQVGYVTEGYHEAVPTNHVADDAIIACAFQEEELSQIATAEAAGFQGPGHELVLAQDWLDPPGWHYDSGHEKEDNGYCKNNKETDDHGNNRAYDSAMKQSNELLIPISSPGAGETHSMEDLVYSLDMADEFALEGEVGKRLTQMVPIAVSIIAYDRLHHFSWQVRLYFLQAHLHSFTVKWLLFMKSVTGNMVQASSQCFFSE